MTEIRLTNSATRRKELFRPLDPARVRLYVCGPTVYDRAHLGNARPVVVFDVLFRLLRHVYGEGAVTYVRNITDIDDKINARAAETGRPIREITEETARWFHEDMGTLGVLPPTHEPRATEWVPAMVSMIETLVARGHAYAAEGHVLFAVDSWREGYGRLSGRSVEDMIAGARVEVAPYKKNPMDFVLWKPSGPGLPGWDSPWGFGRPGWHIECSAMAGALLGERFDIHGGGLDLQFPHHENEVAQSCCAHGGQGPQDMAQVWLHNEMLLVEGKKMSKSLGNFFTVRDLLDRGVPGEVIRFVLLMTHYRSPMDWTTEKAGTAERALRRWRSLVDGIEPAAPAAPAREVEAQLADDLNTSAALTVLGRMGQALFRMAGSRWTPPPPGERSADWTRRAQEFVASARLLGLLGPGTGDWVRTRDLHPFAQRLAALRDDARRTRDFRQVDVLKAALLDAGVEVRMSKTGVELVAGPGFDAAKLEALE